MLFRLITENLLLRSASKLRGKVPVRPKIGMSRSVIHSTSFMQSRQLPSTRPTITYGTFVK